MRRPITVAAALLAGGLLAGCPASRSLPDLQPGEAPPIDSDEAGFWMTMDRVEQKVATAGNLVRAPALNAYLKGVVCRLSPDYCKDLRIYIVQQAAFNAAMAPNGSMTVWTGLLLRAQNEAQLAAVLGHEIAHYQRRHTLKKWRAARDTMGGVQFFRLITAAAGVGLIGDLAALAARGGIASFSRDQELESDQIGLQFMVRSGYDPAEALKLWELVVEEKNAGEGEDQSYFLAKHPPFGDRLVALRRQVAALGAGRGGLELGAERYLRATRPYRADWLRGELRKRNFAETQVILDRLLVSGVNPGELYFFQGELYRLDKAQQDGNRKAIGAYKRALAHKPRPVETYRSLGLVLWSENDHLAALSAFQAYLKARPGAEDRPIIEGYLKELRGGVS